MHPTRLLKAIESALDAHAEWKRKLHRAIETGIAHLSSATASCDDKCELGHWLYSDTVTDSFQHEPQYHRVIAAHARFHRTAGSVLAYVERGNSSAALFIMEGEYDYESGELVEALTAWKAATVIPAAA